MNPATIPFEKLVGHRAVAIQIEMAIFQKIDLTDLQTGVTVIETDEASTLSTVIVWEKRGWPVNIEFVGCYESAYLYAAYRGLELADAPCELPAF